jgi:hypothetical protein
LLDKFLSHNRNNETPEAMASGVSLGISRSTLNQANG